MTKKISIPQTGEDIVDLALHTIAMKKQALVFVGSKRGAEATAEKIAKKLKEDTSLNELSDEVLNTLGKPTKQCERLAKLVKKGLIFHHAGLHSKQRELLEDAFKEGKIKIICATPTLSAGVDTPAFRSIIKDVKRFDGRWGMNYIPVLEYLQMAGRAGRPGREEYGEAILLAATETEKEKLYDRYICGVPEEIYSKLAVEPVLRTYVLSLIATEFVNTEKEIFTFFSKTFWAYQYKDMYKLQTIILKMLHLLEEYQFITINQEDFRSANEEEETKVTATFLGKRVAELYFDPLTAHNLIEGMQKIKEIKKDVSSFSVLQLVSAQLEIRPPLSVRVGEIEKIQASLAKEEFLMDEPTVYDTEYEEFLASVKTALFFGEWIEEKDEEYILEEYNIRPGEIKVKIDNCDWLLYGMEELAKVLHFQTILKDLAKLRFRVKEGVKEELLTLLQLKDIGRIRARKMYNKNIKSFTDIRQTDIIVLAEILGKKTALHVKEQVGQKIEEKNAKEEVRKNGKKIKEENVEKIKNSKNVEEKEKSEKKEEKEKAEKGDQKKQSTLTSYDKDL